MRVLRSVNASPTGFWKRLFSSQGWSSLVPGCQPDPRVEPKICGNLLALNCQCLRRDRWQTGPVRGEVRSEPPL